MTGRRGICAQHVQVEQRFGTAASLKGQNNERSRNKCGRSKRNKSRPDLDSDPEVTKENLEVAASHLAASKQSCRWSRSMVYRYPLGFEE